LGYPGDARVTGPLTGLHVAEIATEISGPYAAKLFVDLGAEVINDQIVRGLGLSDDDLATLRDLRVIGERVLNA
jgi:hypothetical protein